VKKSIAIFFLFVFCISLPGFSVELHYCKGEITDISFIGETNCVCKGSKEEQTTESTETISCKKHCHKEAAIDDSKENLKQEKKCCKTEKLTFASSKLKAISSSKFNQIVALLAIVNPFLIGKLLQKADTDFLLYEPPIKQRDLQILNSVFII
jgi:hypothetical protein